MATAPVVALVKAIEAEKLTSTEIIMTTKGPGIPAKL